MMESNHRTLDVSQVRYHYVNRAGRETKSRTWTNALSERYATATSYLSGAQENRTLRTNIASVHRQPWNMAPRKTKNPALWAGL